MSRSVRKAVKIGVIAAGRTLVERLEAAGTAGLDGVELNHPGPYPAGLVTDAIARTGGVRPGDRRRGPLDDAAVGPGSTRAPPSPWSSCAAAPGRPDEQLCGRRRLNLRGVPRFCRAPRWDCSHDIRARSRRQLEECIPTGCDSHSEPGRWRCHRRAAVPPPGRAHSLDGCAYAQGDGSVRTCCLLVEPGSYKRSGVY